MPGEDENEGLKRAMTEVFLRKIYFKLLMIKLIVCNII